jgi:transposase-like protein
MLIVENLEAKASDFACEIEPNSSYFGGTRQGKRGGGTAKNVSVFGILKRGGTFIRKLL